MHQWPRTDNFDVIYPHITSITLVLEFGLDKHVSFDYIVTWRVTSLVSLFLGSKVLIKNFKHKGLEKFFYDGTLKGIQAKHADRLGNILDLLDAADEPKVMNFPGSKLHPLQPKNKNLFAIKVSGNWRITFVFQNGNAYDVDYVDYH